MVYEDAEKLYAEVCTDTQTLLDQALHTLYPSSILLSSVATVPASVLLTVFAHNTMFFPHQDVVHMLLTKGRISSGNVLQMTSDGKEGYIFLEGSTGSGLILPSQISTQGPWQCTGPHSHSRSPWLTHHLGLISADVMVHSASSDAFVLGNRAIQLTITGGQITSLFDVWLKCILFLFFATLCKSPESLTHVLMRLSVCWIIAGVSSSLRARQVV
jgi:alpha-mannosidase